MKINNLKKFLAGIVLVLGVTIAPIAAASNFALAATYDPGNGATCGANGKPVTDATGNVKCEVDTDTTKSLPAIVAFIINVFSWIIGAVSVIMIIYGGFRYITSGGDSNGVTAAKNTILYAIIGLIIVALAQIIVNFVLNKTTSIQ